MKSRTAAITVIAMGTLVLSTGVAAARPAPDPPPWQVTTVTAGTDTLLADLVVAYARASLADKRRIHNEITLLVNLGGSART